MSLGRDAIPIGFHGARDRRHSLEAPVGSPLSDSAHAAWPRTWAASSDWAARVGTTSLAESLRRSTYAAGPVANAEDEGQRNYDQVAFSTPPEGSDAGSSRIWAGGAAGAAGAAAAAPSPPPGAGASRRSRLRHASLTPLTPSGDLEESLLYDFDESLDEEGDDGQQGWKGAQPRQQQQQQHHQQHQQQQQQQADGRPSATDNAAAVCFRFDSGPISEVHWEATPFLSGTTPPPGRGTSLINQDHSYVITRRHREAAAGRLPSGLATPTPAPAPAEEGYREVIVVHVEQEGPTSSTLQTAFNAVNILCGVGLLTTPFALSAGGWASLLVLLIVGGMACTTGSMLASCMAKDKGIRSYPDIGGAACGTPGRVLVSCLLYLELFCCCVDFVILEGDGLSALAPGYRLTVLGVTLTAKQSMMVVACAILLPTVLMRDLSLLSYLSVFGIFASVLLISLVGSAAPVIGFPNAHLLPGVAWGGLPTAAALYSFCFSGHAVFPSLYASLRCKRNFPCVLFGSFALVLVMYGSMAVIGACMFPGVSDNVVLDLQGALPRAAPTHVAMWTVIINPLSKVALTLTPVAMALEELLPCHTNTRAFALASASIRTALLAGVLLVALCCPFFGIVMSLIGAVFSMSISIVLPCLFYYRICAPGPLGAAACAAIGAFGAAVGVVSTADAFRSLMEKY